MAQRQIGHRKSSLVLTARFPVVKWRSRSFTLKFLSIITFNICKITETSFTECKQHQLSRPVNYQGFRETGPRVSMTTKAAKETMHPWEWGCHWSTGMRFIWIKLPDSATSHNIFALSGRACYRQSQTSNVSRSIGRALIRGGLNRGFTVVVIKLSRSVLLISRSALSAHVSRSPKKPPY